MKIYPNGVGVVDWFENRIDQVFTWEVKGDFIQFNFGTNLNDCYYGREGLNYLYRGTQLATYNSTLGDCYITGLQVLSGDNFQCENLKAYDICFQDC